MLQKYSVENGRLVQNAPGFPRISVYNRPDESERRYLIDQCGLDEHTLISSTDPNETPRVEFEENHVFYVCPQGCVRLLFDEATETEFLCPMCGEDLVYYDNSRFVGVLKKRVEALSSA